MKEVIPVKILIINGPNLNFLGRRDSHLYGTKTLEEINHSIALKANELGLLVNFFQSNHEGDLIDFIQANSNEHDAMIINAGALTHYGLSLADAITDSKIPTIEVHLSNIHSREKFRRKSVIARLCIGQIAGFGSHGYIMALSYFANLNHRKPQ